MILLRHMVFQPSLNHSRILFLQHWAQNNAYWVVDSTCSSTMEPDIDPIAQHSVFKLFHVQSSPLSCLLNFLSICTLQHKSPLHQGVIFMEVQKCTNFLIVSQYIKSPMKITFPYNIGKSLG